VMPMTARRKRKIHACGNDLFVIDNPARPYLDRRQTPPDRASPVIMTEQAMTGLILINNPPMTHMGGRLPPNRLQIKLLHPPHAERRLRGTPSNHRGSSPCRRHISVPLCPNDPPPYPDWAGCIQREAHPSFPQQKRTAQDVL
jgi:hypothetical protein